MADHEYHGNSGVILTDPGVLSIDQSGLATCTAVFTTQAAQYRTLPSIGAVHPIFTALSMESQDIALKGLFAIATCNYGGVEEASFASRLPVYELKVGLSDEPIDTHPDFQTKIGGTPTKPLNGASFRNVEHPEIITGPTVSASSDTGFVFKEFQIFVNGKLNPLAKVESYLEAACLTWSKTVSLRTPVSSIEEVGKISNPEGPAPKLGKGRNWLFMGITQTKRGSAYQSVTEWRASGRRGWNEDIYG